MSRRDELSREQKDRLIKEAMLGNLIKTKNVPPPLPIKFARLCDSTGRFDLISIVDNVAQYRAREFLMVEILKWNHSLHPTKHRDYLISDRALSVTTTKILHSLKEIKLEDIKPFAFASDKSLTFHRCDFDPCDGPTPTFDEFLSRCSDPDLLQKYIGSIFVNESYPEQFMLIRGYGGDGKGSLIDAITTAMGASAFHTVTVIPGKDSQRFFTSSLRGKRLVVFPDLSDLKFLDSDCMKPITGGDKNVTLEEKGKQARNEQLRCKVLALTNSRADFKYSDAIFRRLLMVDVAKASVSMEGRSSLYKESMIAEGRFIIKKCMDFYHRHCSDHRALTPSPGCDLEAVNSVWDDVSAFVDELLQTKFTVDHTPSNRNKPLARFPVMTFAQEIYADYGPFLKDMKITISDIYNHLDQKFGVYKLKARVIVPGDDDENQLTKPVTCLMGLRRINNREKTESHKNTILTNTALERQRHAHLTVVPTREDS